MAKQYQVNRGVRIQNSLVALLVRLGIVPRWHLLAVEGRKTGKLRETPIDPLELDGKRYLVAPFGVVNWVRNARAAGRVRLRKGRKTEFLKVRETPPSESAPVLQAYYNRGYTEEYFDAGPESSIDQFEAEAGNHPVFEVVSAIAPFA
jgi:deazaflavin-dependent oxidoreductase (nitroreductase family)